LPMMSRDISVQLSSVLKKKGVKILTSYKVKEIRADHSVVADSLKGEIAVDADAVIIAIGRKCNLKEIGLENANVNFDRFVKVDDNMRTSVENIFACGDIVGRAQLAHFASASAQVAVDSMLGEKASIDLSVVPSCVYTNPQIALVGKTELEQGYKQGKFMMGANGKSLIQGSNRGYVKVVADENNVICGAEIFAINGTEIIGELALAVQKKMKVEEVAKVIHAHPTIMEAVGEAYEDIFGLATHKM
ncbi:MAG TPA: FAD-dependent oxidoreductase, partial [Clostridia bacterium]|nr:FAD-dependent oxidoreductase [Clostridia bacterium]